MSLFIFEDDSVNITCTVAALFDTGVFNETCKLFKRPGSVKNLMVELFTVFVGGEVLLVKLLVIEDNSGCTESADVDITI